MSDSLPPGGQIPYPPSPPAEWRSQLGLSGSDGAEPMGAAGETTAEATREASGRAAEAGIAGSELGHWATSEAWLSCCLARHLAVFGGPAAVLLAGMCAEHAVHAEPGGSPGGAAAGLWPAPGAACRELLGWLGDHLGALVLSQHCGAVSSRQSQGMCETGWFRFLFLSLDFLRLDGYGSVYRGAVLSGRA